MDMISIIFALKTYHMIYIDTTLNFFTLNTYGTIFEHDLNHLADLIADMMPE